jgi:hypothetical protein
MKFLRCFVVIFLISLNFICTNPSDTNPQNISINYVSVQSGDSLNPGAGFIARFSCAVKLNSFKAQEIQKIYDIDYSDSTGPKSYSINLQVYKIIAAENVQVNGQPLTFWYNPATYEIALFEETTIQMPFGTGEGLVIDQDSTEVIFKAGITAQNGGTLGTDYRLFLNRATNTYRLRVVPNPAYPSFTSQGLQYPRANFNDLPATCVINIYDQANTLMASLQHDGGGVEQWDLIRDNGTNIETGIFRFEIIENAVIVPGGIFVFPAFE